MQCARIAAEFNTVNKDIVCIIINPLRRGSPLIAIEQQNVPIQKKKKHGMI